MQFPMISLDLLSVKGIDTAQAGYLSPKGRGKHYAEMENREDLPNSAESIVQIVDLDGAICT